ncbi:MAG: transcriptional repressor [Actinobacteria bacterium]|nr:transcriptional repressor [Actinomycetota bacterium]
MRSPTELGELFRSTGRKNTAQRQCIFELLHGSTAHPTAEAIFAEARAKMPSISLRTVYQTLNDLASLGEIQQLDLGTGSFRFDPNIDSHHHLVCIECGSAQDIYAAFPEVQVPPAVAGDFELTSTEVVFRGRCASCRRP